MNQNVIICDNICYFPLTHTPKHVLHVHVQDVNMSLNKLYRMRLIELNELWPCTTIIYLLASKD